VNVWLSLHPSHLASAIEAGEDSSLANSCSIHRIKANRNAEQVLRWSALAFGIFYGITHQASISSKDRTAQLNREYERKRSLIQQAKEEYQRQTNPQPPQPSGQGKQPLSHNSFTSNGLQNANFHLFAGKPDLEGANFDIEAYLHLK
jgi:F-type H+-transporting ATP synthase subunit e